MSGPPRARRVRTLTLLAALAGAAVAFAAWIFGRHGGDTFFGHLFKAYQPREFCMFYDPAVIRLHLWSDVCIALAYYSIPVALIYFVRRRRDLTFGWMFVCFAVFILACGTTHVMNVIALWYAPYRLDGLVKAFTAVVSVATAIVLWPLIPRALAIPSPAALRQANDDLAREVETRRAAEESLRRMQGSLEKTVDERTAELRATNERLQAEIAARESAEQARRDLLTREQTARAEAERAGRMKDEFLATLSHELRTPLSAISGWIGVLRGPGVDPAEREEGLAVIDRNTRAQIQLIEDLLDMSRINAGKLRLDVQSVDLARVIDAAVDTVAPSAAAKNVALVKVIDPLARAVSGDPARLQQVVWNLLSNAIKFTPAKGRVQVSLERVNSHLEIVVADNGCGIEPDFLPHLFERFRQADGSSTRRHGGLGLGLAISRHLIELHGGSVRAKSAGPGQGSTFVIALPVRAAHPEADETLREHPASASGGEQPKPVRLDGLAVLLVEDEADSRHILGRILERAGARVLSAATAAEGMRLLAAEKPDVIVSDIGMPGEDGYAFMRRVRGLDGAQGGLIPAVALTAFARTEDRIRALAAGFQMHLAKPVESAELLLVIASVVQRGAGGTGRASS